MRAMAAIAGLVLKEIFRKKDFYVAAILIGVILFYAQSLKFYNVENISRYLLDMGLSLVFYFSVILSIALSARQVPAEVQTRTLTLLLSKPISRFQFVAGKFLGSFIASASAFTVFYIFLLGVAAMKAGVPAFGVVFETYFLFLLNLMIVTSMTSAFSYHLTVGANVTISLVIYFLISLYGATMKNIGLIYYTWPHFEFYDLRQRLVHGWPGISASLAGILFLYALFYTFFFLSWANGSFRRRPL